MTADTTAIMSHKNNQYHISRYDMLTFRQATCSLPCCNLIKASLHLASEPGFLSLANHQCTGRSSWAHSKTFNISSQNLCISSYVSRICMKHYFISILCTVKDCLPNGTANMSSPSPQKKHLSRCFKISLQFLCFMTSCRMDQQCGLSVGRSNLRGLSDKFVGENEHFSYLFGQPTVGLTLQLFACDFDQQTAITFVFLCPGMSRVVNLTSWFCTSTSLFPSLIWSSHMTWKESNTYSVLVG